MAFKFPEDIFVTFSCHVGVGVGVHLLLFITLLSLLFISSLCFVLSSLLFSFSLLFPSHPPPVVDSSS